MRPISTPALAKQHHALHRAARFTARGMRGHVPEIAEVKIVGHESKA
ncbi:MAG: hypothetical protein WDM89_04585 [Rhizomicrobium sp.]